MRKLLLLLATLVAALSISAGVAMAASTEPAAGNERPGCSVLTDDRSNGVQVCDLVDVQDLVDVHVPDAVDVNPTVGPPTVDVRG